MRVARVAWIVVIAFGLLSGISISGADAQPFSLKGTWNGRYQYSDNRNSVDFTLELDAGDGRCLGRMKEPNTFSEKSARFLFANVSCLSTGVQPGREFRFHKQYDGTGGVTHAVEYSGIVSADGNTITGHWVILSSASWSTGAFSMSRSR
jgi:hypothetical protein